MKTRSAISAVLMQQAAVSPGLRACFEILSLKQLYRQGWLKRGLPEEKCETVADHSFAVAMLALLLVQQRPDLDQAKVLKLALLHDLGEVHAGDLTPDDGISAREKASLEQAGIQQLLAGVAGAGELLSLWQEYESQASDEACFVRELDRLDLALQAVVYEYEGSITAGEFMDTAAKVIAGEPQLGMLQTLLQLRP